VGPPGDVILKYNGKDCSCARPRVGPPGDVILKYNGKDCSCARPRVGPRYFSCKIALDFCRSCARPRVGPRRCVSPSPRSVTVAARARAWVHAALTGPAHTIGL